MSKDINVLLNERNRIKELLNIEQNYEKRRELQRKIFLISSEISSIKK